MLHIYILYYIYSFSRYLRFFLAVKRLGRKLNYQPLSWRDQGKLLILTYGTTQM